MKMVVLLFLSNTCMIFLQAIEWLCTFSIFCQQYNVNHEFHSKNNLEGPCSHIKRRPKTEASKRLVNIIFKKMSFTNTITQACMKKTAECQRESHPES